MHRLLLVVTILAGSIAPCSALVFGCGGEVLEDGQGTHSDGTGDGDAAATSPRREAGVGKGECPVGLPGPQMVPLLEKSGVPFCMDATEVSVAEYAAFVSANVSPSTQAAMCAQNSSFSPLFPAAASDANHPVVNVDWCDARAYCAWAGKKMCGAPGGGSGGASGGTSGSAHDDTNPDTSLLYSACSDLGAHGYPYGSTYQPGVCNGADDDILATLDVNLPASCIDSSKRISNLSGNVWEWEDACESNDPLARCRLRGGSFRSNAESLACAAANLAARNSAFDDFGFRCCAE